jgi:hypothetical protein
LVDPECARHLIDGEHYADAMRNVAGVTQYERTARLSHLMRGV